MRIGGADTAAYAPESVLAGGVRRRSERVPVRRFGDGQHPLRPARRHRRRGAEAYRLANADRFVRALPEGYASRIGENGGRLSGGERQRLSARASCATRPSCCWTRRRPRSTSRTSCVKEAIANLLAKRKTVVMVAHTLAIVRGADSIAVVGDGRVLGRAHDELVAAGGKYARMWAADRELA
ncbi:MAG: hypothetical protein ACLSVD_00340 [Eggerthellaceae bacterium]